MYNRYIRNEDGAYLRIPQSERTPPPPPPPPPREDAPPPPPPPREEDGSAGKFLGRILEKLHLGDLNAADLMLLALLFFLVEEKADDELLIGLGLLLIL